MARFTVNISNLALKELNRGNCIHRTIYNYHPDEIGYCSPAKECYRNEKPYYFSQIEPPDIYLTNTTTDGQVFFLTYEKSQIGSKAPVTWYSYWPFNLTFRSVCQRLLWALNRYQKRFLSSYFGFGSAVDGIIPISGDNKDIIDSRKWLIFYDFVLSPNAKKILRSVIPLMPKTLQ